MGGAVQGPGAPAAPVAVVAGLPCFPQRPAPIETAARPTGGAGSATMHDSAQDMTP